MKSKWTVGKRIVLGFSLVLVLLVVIGGISIWALTSASGGFGEYRTLARETDVAGRLNADMLSVRMQVKEFVVTGSDEDHQQFDKAWSRLEDVHAEAVEMIAQPKLARTLKESHRLMEQYSDAFAELVKVRQEIDATYAGVLNMHGPRVTDDLTGLMESPWARANAAHREQVGEAREHFLRARVNVVKFVSGEEELAEMVRDDLTAAEKFLGDLAPQVAQAEAAGTVRDLAGRVATYTEGFDQLAELTGRRNDLIVNELDRLGPIFAGKIDDITHEIKQRQDTVGPRVQRANATAVTLVSVIAGVALLAGIVSAWVITRSISRRLQDVIIGLANGSEQTTAASAEVSSASQGLADGASRQAAALEETSTSIDQLSIVVKSNAEKAQRVFEMTEKNTATTGEARSLASDTADFARKGEETMNEMAGTIDRIKESAEQTGRIVTTINEIAFQTNLLALNAAVEAARAGEAGKGFAVVAEEVRNLAQRSAKAAQETGLMIDESVKNAEGGVGATQRVTEVFQQIAEKIRSIADRVGEVATASEEQSTLVGEVTGANKEQAEKIGMINDGVEQIDTVTQANASGAEELAASAEELNSQAEDLNRYVRELEAFVGSVRQRDVQRFHTDSRWQGQGASAPQRPAGGKPKVRAKTGSGGPGRSKLKRPEGSGEGSSDGTSPEQVIPLEDAADIASKF